MAEPQVDRPHVPGYGIPTSTEGTASEIVAPPQPQANAILAGYHKYRTAKDYEADPANWSSGGLWELTPVKAFAWSSFPKYMTRFRF